MRKTFIRNVCNVTNHALEDIDALEINGAASYCEAMHIARAAITKLWEEYKLNGDNDVCAEIECSNAASMILEAARDVANAAGVCVYT